MANTEVMEAMQVQATSFMDNFLQTYYGTFQGNRANLAGIFDENVSIFSFEGSRCVGRESIMKKLTGLPFKSLAFSITTTDSHPTVDNAYISMVVGQLKTDDDPPHGFSQVFHVKNSPNGNPILLNSSFRLALHSQ